MMINTSRALANGMRTDSSARSLQGPYHQVGLITNGSDKDNDLPE